MFTCCNVKKKLYSPHTVCLNIPVFTLCLKCSVLGAWVSSVGRAGAHVTRLSPNRGGPGSNPACGPFRIHSLSLPPFQDSIHCPVNKMLKMPPQKKKNNFETLRFSAFQQNCVARQQLEVHVYFLSADVGHLVVVRLRQPVKLQFTSMSVQNVITSSLHHFIPVRHVCKIVIISI